MCIVPKAPKIPSTAAKVKDPAIIRNPILDGMDPITKALRKGRSSLRIERAAPVERPVAPAGVAPGAASSLTIGRT